MTALQLITRTAANNGWSVAKTRSSGDGHHFIVQYVRDGELVDIQYTPSDSVHSSLYIPRRGLIEFVGPGATGRRAAAIRWLKRGTLQ